MTSLPRVLLTLHTLAFLAVGASHVSAQDLFGNPFASAEALRLQRGALPNATLRLRYEASGDPRTGPGAGELVIDVAPDWAHVRRPDRQTLYDFRLGRVLELRDGAFVSRNIMSEVVFRIYERENRAYLTGVIRSAGGTSPVDGCDAETELGVAIPALKEPATVEVKQSGATTTLECNGRVVGMMEQGPRDATPAALWPLLAHEMTMHPALHAAAAKSGRPPRRVEASFKVAGAHKAPSWRLVAAEPIAAPYPLAAKLANTTAARINEAAAPGLGDLAAEAVAGRAQGGPPTLASWEAEVGRLATEKGPAAAAFAVWQAFNMFPQAVQACQSGATSPLCNSLRSLGTTATTDAAVRALFEVIKAQQLRRPADAVAAMLGARSSPLADHPALGASFALALQNGGDSVRKQAQAAGLPSDAKPLHVRAVQAYPYNPAYWTDLGDHFARVYDLRTAYALYDVALSLPMPDAQHSNVALAGKRSLAARIKSDFPAFFLAK